MTATVIPFAPESMPIRFKRFFSVDSAKAIKADKFGYLDAINYMAPHTAGGVGNLCSHASPGCIALCLGLYSGQASMVSAKTNWTNSVRDSRVRKAEYFMRERNAFLCETATHIAKLVRRAKKLRKKLCVRPNGSTDIAYEGLRFFVSPEFAAKLTKLAGVKVAPGLHTIFSLFPDTQFIDYTKNPNRFKRPLPSNYYLTFSYSEKNEAGCRALLAAGVNVAVCFAGAKPDTFLGAAVIDGDKHDLRHLDPRGGVIVGLAPKGLKALRDASGFVVRLAA